MAEFPFQTRKLAEEWLNYMCSELHDQIRILNSHFLEVGVVVVVVVGVVVGVVSLSNPLVLSQVVWCGCCGDFEDCSNNCREKMVP